MKIIKAEEKITSNVFYEKLMPKVVYALNYMEKGEEIIVDLSLTESIDAMAIPLLLNMARWIINRVNSRPRLYISNAEKKKTLMEYLEKIGFFDACDYYDYYEVCARRVKVKKDLVNFNTFIFIENAINDSQEERERIEEYVCKKLNNNMYQLFWKYWEQYDILDSVNYANGVEWMTRAICANTGIHTKVNTILTLQRNIRLKKVCISVADCGCGLYESFRKKVIEKGYRPVSTTTDKFLKLKGEEADLHAIVEALTYRFGDRVYGLYHVLMRNLELSKNEMKKNNSNYKERTWIMRIHTNQKRVVLTGKNCFELKYAITPEQFAKKILNLAKSEYVARKTFNYPGVHIEIEIPYNEEKM